MQECTGIVHRRHVLLLPLVIAYVPGQDLQQYSTEARSVRAQSTSC